MADAFLRDAALHLVEWVNPDQTANDLANDLSLAGLATMGDEDNHMVHLLPPIIRNETANTLMLMALAKYKSAHDGDLPSVHEMPRINMGRASRFSKTTHLFSNYVEDDYAGGGTHYIASEDGFSSPFPVETLGWLDLIEDGEFLPVFDEGVKFAQTHNILTRASAELSALVLYAMWGHIEEQHRFMIPLTASWLLAKQSEGKKTVENAAHIGALIDLNARFAEVYAEGLWDVEYMKHLLHDGVNDANNMAINNKSKLVLVTYRNQLGSRIRRTEKSSDISPALATIFHIFYQNISWNEVLLPYLEDYDYTTEFVQKYGVVPCLRFMQDQKSANYAAKWMSAGVYDPADASRYTDMGISPEDAGKIKDAPDSWTSGW